MTDIVEHVARAICCPLGCERKNNDDCRAKFYWDEEAHAAIKAVLEAIRGPMYLSRDSQRALDQLIKEMDKANGT